MDKEDYDNNYIWDMLVQERRRSNLKTGIIVSLIFILMGLLVLMAVINFADFS